jgi:hypothetical protein
MNSPGTARSSLTDQAFVDDEIDLRQLVRTLWLQRRIIAGIFIVGTLLGIGAGLYSTHYVSDGLFLMRVPVNAYKSYENALFNGPRLQHFFKISGHQNEPAAVLLKPLVDKPKTLREALIPVFGFTDKDARALGVKVEQSDFLTGIRLIHEGRRPSGGAPVLLLAEYVRDTVIRVEMGVTMLESCMKYRAREQILRNEQIKNDFDIEQQERRVQTLKDIVASRPDAVIPDSPRSVPLEKGAERYLSPVSQLVAAEILISDMKLDETARERERIASALKRDYYCQAKKTLDQSITGEKFLAGLAPIQAAVFKGQDMNAEIVEQTWNELDIELTDWTNRYLREMRFVASPEGAEIYERKPGLALGAILGGMLGGMLGIFCALILAWWRANRDAITMAS